MDAPCRDAGWPEKFQTIVGFPSAERAARGPPEINLELFDNEHFPQIIPGEKKFERSETAEKIFDVAIVEDAQ